MKKIELTLGQKNSPRKKERKKKSDKSSQLFFVPVILNSQHTHLHENSENIGNILLKC